MALVITTVNRFFIKAVRVGLTVGLIRINKKGARWVTLQLR